MIVLNLLYREQRLSSGSVPAILEDGPALFCTKHNRRGLAYDRAYTQGVVTAIGAVVTAATGVKIF